MSSVAEKAFVDLLRKDARVEAFYRLYGEAWTIELFFVCLAPVYIYEIKRASDKNLMESVWGALFRRMAKEAELPEPVFKELCKGICGYVVCEVLQAEEFRGIVQAIHAQEDAKERS